MNNELFIKCFRKDMVKDELDEKLDQIYNSIKKVQSKIRITDTEYEFDVRINPFFYKPIVSHIMESSIQNINLDNLTGVKFFLVYIFFMFKKLLNL